MGDGNGNVVWVARRNSRGTSQLYIYIYVCVSVSVSVLTLENLVYESILNNSKSMQVFCK